jgi:hypothetical protein
MIFEKSPERLFQIQSQLNFLYDCFSQPTGPLELSDAGHEGVCTMIGSLADQIEEVNEELMAEGKTKKKVKVK